MAVTSGTTGATVGANGALTLASAGSKASKGLAGVDFTTYITLLAKQLQNQDPMKPMDSSEFTSQIATYAQLEQTTSSNQYLQKIAEAKDYGVQALASSYLGKEVLVSGNQITFDGTSSVDFGYTLSEVATGATVEVLNSRGASVRTLNVDTAAGAHSLTWDGKNDAGETLAAGTYTVRLHAVDAEGENVSGDTLAYALAAEMITTDGETNLKLANGAVVAFGDVTSMRLPR